MKPIIHTTFFLITLTTLLTSASAQEATWSIGFKSVFDNREGSRTYTPPMTYFFTQVSPESGLKFSDTDRIAGGVVWTQHLTNEWADGTIVPTVYYRHDTPQWGFSMGLVPRAQLHHSLPDFLWCDSLSYFQPNLRGALVQYDGRGTHNWWEAYIDWRGMQSETRREAFNIVTHGEAPFGTTPFFIGGRAMMNHLALQKNSPADQHIVDNFMVNPYIGIDLSDHTTADTLTARIGTVTTIERNRANRAVNGGWTTPTGAWVELHARWQWLSLTNTTYIGNRCLFPSYGEFGGLLYQGEPFYNSPYYNRSDIAVGLHRNKWMELYTSLNFNVAKDSFIFYQRLSVRVYVDSFSAKK